MGKSAVNAPLELIAMHMNQCYGKKYHISQILEAIDANISNFYTPATWGYNMFYYIAAFNDCHPNYVSYLMDKRTLSVKSINEILGQLKGEKRLLYDKDYIEDFALKMGAMNNTRKGITNSCFEQVSSRLDESRYDALFYEEPDPIGNCLVLNDKDVVEGISGILASKLLDKYNRPVLVMTDCGNGKLKGSARSLYPVDIKKVFDEISDVFISYGGHAYSAGFTLEESQFHNLDYKLNEKLSHLNPNDFTKHIYIDVILSGKLEDSSICDVFDCMAPFGQGFPKPMFMYKNFVVDKQKTNANKTNSPYVGKDGKTLRLVNNDRLVAIMFKYADKYKTMLEPGVVNLVGRPVINEYNGYRNIQFMVEEDYIIKVK